MGGVRKCVTLNFLVGMIPVILQVQGIGISVGEYPVFLDIILGSRVVGPQLRASPTLEGFTSDCTYPGVE